ncbi:phage antirepressor N-terminal domain-containing protein [Aquamicrobium defluvii]|uniref:P22-like antirepressor protein n=1 Tax=Aquamicrobium defluvii TaxID=69279 RepID=A0A4R6YI87_9HYPH|nr:phage antirepressor N-terminal domain-containing protein [Aquamicrobium defluvii]TDR36527.1 P22-like antirepressor protein [Aquamicrobium defluvii]
MGQIVTVNFRGDQLYGFESDDGVFVALKPIVESIGMNWSGQEQRVKRDPILSEGICVMHTPFGPGGGQDCLCLKMDLVNGWLFTIDSARIKDQAVREKVILYQRECYGVLFKHFYKGAKPVQEPLVIEDHEETASPDNAKVRLVTECRQTFGSKASGQLWFQLGLPTVPAMIEQSRQFDLLDFEAIKTASDSRAA